MHKNKCKRINIFCRLQRQPCSWVHSALYPPPRLCTAQRHQEGAGGDGISSQFAHCLPTVHSSEKRVRYQQRCLPFSKSCIHQAAWLGLSRQDTFFSNLREGPCGIAVLLYHGEIWTLFPSSGSYPCKWYNTHDTHSPLEKNFGKTNPIVKISWMLKSEYARGKRSPDWDVYMYCSSWQLGDLFLKKRKLTKSLQWIIQDIHTLFFFLLELHQLGIVSVLVGFISDNKLL